MGKMDRGDAMIDLRFGDAFDGIKSMADKSVDATITDPPFDARTHRAALESKDWRAGSRKVDKVLPFPPLTNEQMVELAHHLARITKGWIILFAGERQLETWAQALELAGARVIRFGIAQRTNPKPQLSGDRPGQGVDHLVVAHAGDGRMRWNAGGKCGVWPSPAARWDSGGKQIHPTQKPESLMVKLIEDFTLPGELVFDPFFGSGTTAVACQKTQRRFVGFENDAAFYEIAKARVAASEQQQNLFDAVGS